MTRRENFDQNDRCASRGGRFLAFWAKNAKKLIAAALALLFLLSLAPMLTIAKYDRPSSDDYVYAQLTKHVWDKTHSVIKLLAAAAETSLHTYQSWQGSYAGCFLMALQPGIFGEKIYPVAPVFLILSLAAAIGVFLFVLLRRLLNMDGASIAIVAIVCAAVSVNYLPYAAEAFYWYNGGVYYTFFYALLLLLFALLIDSAFSERAKALRIVLAALLGAVIGGGNLVVGLTAQLLLAGYAALRILLKKRDPVALAALAAFTLGFAVNLLAPGNAVRQLTMGARPGAVQSVLTGIYYAVLLLRDWMTAPVILSGLVLVPLFVPYADRLIARFRFRFPALAPVGSVLLVAAGLVPLVYAGNHLNVPRVYAVLFYESVLLYYFSLFYCCGWVCRVVREDASHAFSRAMRFAVPALLAAALVTLLPKYPAYDRQEAPTCVVAYKSLKLRDAYEFARDRDARLPMLENPAISDAVVGRVTARPALFHNRDISSDPAGDRNRALAAYYGKNSVTLG